MFAARALRPRDIKPRAANVREKKMTGIKEDEREGSKRERIKRSEDARLRMRRPAAWLRE